MKYNNDKTDTKDGKIFNMYSNRNDMNRRNIINTSNILIVIA